MTFDSFRKSLRVKSDLAEIQDIEDHKSFFLTAFNVNKLVGRSDFDRHTGRTLHNTLMSLYLMSKNVSSLTIVMNTQDKQRLIREYERLTSQLSYKDRIEYSHNFKHDLLNIVSINAFQDEIGDGKRKYDNIVLDNSVVKLYHDIKNNRPHKENVEKFFSSIVDKSYKFLNTKQSKTTMTSVNYVEVYDDSAKTHDGSIFCEGDLFILGNNTDNSASNVGTILNISKNKYNIWGSFVEVMINGKLYDFSIDHLEYFTKL